MAEKLNVLKARIKAVSSTHKITKTMDMIARSRTAKILTVEQGMRPFTQKLNRIVEDLSHSDMDHVHPLLAPKKKIKNIILFVVTSSRGLCGSYNTKIFDEAMERIRHHHRHGREVQLHVLGKKGEVYFEKQGIPIARKDPRIDEESTFDDCATVVQRFMHEYAVDNASRVEVIYTRYYTRVVHIPKIKSLIPMIPDEEDIEGHKINPDFQIGCMLAMSPVYPATCKPMDQMAALKEMDRTFVFSDVQCRGHCNNWLEPRWTLLV